ncbi:MAG: hypothetical protein ACOH2D_06625 [Gelidibacter sp.]
MKSFITKLKSAFSESKSADKPNNDAFTEAIINDVDGNPFALSETNVLYAGLSELAGYHYFKTIIIGTFKVKTFQGAKLIVNGGDFTLELSSDSMELESESSNIPNRNITRIDFEIDHQDISKISRTAIESIEVIAKKNHVKFSIIEGDYDQELTDQELVDEKSADVELEVEVLAEDVQNLKEK